MCVYISRDITVYKQDTREVLDYLQQSVHDFLSVFWSQAELDLCVFNGRDTPGIPTMSTLFIPHAIAVMETAWTFESLTSCKSRCILRLLRTLLNWIHFHYICKTHGFGSHGALKSVTALGTTVRASRLADVELHRLRRPSFLHTIGTFHEQQHLVSWVHPGPYG